MTVAGPCQGRQWRRPQLSFLVSFALARATQIESPGCKLRKDFAKISGAALALLAYDRPKTSDWRETRHREMDADGALISTRPLASLDTSIYSRTTMSVPKVLSRPVGERPVDWLGRKAGALKLNPGI